MAYYPGLHYDCFASRLQPGEGPMALTSRDSSSNENFLPFQSVNRSEADIGSLDLLFGFTHDLRSPLFALMGYLQLLQVQLQGEVSPKVQDYLQHANEAGQRLDRMVKEMLDLLRCDQAAFSPPFEDISIPDLFKRLWNTALPIAEQRSIQLRMVVKGEEQTTIWACNSLLERALDNLVSNAIKFSGNGGEVTLTCFRREEAIVFEVSDRGRGIPLEAQVRIFQPFVQAQEKDRLRGFGLGLPMARFVARLHGGDIDLVSTVGQGSRFQFWIPTAAPRELFGENIGQGMNSAIT